MLLWLVFRATKNELFMLQALERCELLLDEVYKMFRLNSD